MGEEGGVQPNRGTTIQEISLAVRRDLEDLLNTRPIIDPSRLDGVLGESLLAYGVPDLTGYDLHSREQATNWLDNVRHAIERFEPRLRHPKLSLTNSPDQLDPTLRFRITATLVVHPLEQSVQFDSIVERSTGNINVQVTE
jgi:type VI secretion system protein ImpF